MKQIKLSIYIITAKVDDEFIKNCWDDSKVKKGDTVFLTSGLGDYTHDIKEAAIYFSKEDAENAIDTENNFKDGKEIFKDRVTKLDFVAKGKKK
jgi:peroxiredoxin